MTTASPTQNNFNPRAPYGARRVKEEEIFLIIDISIHAPHTGRDAEVEKLRAELKISIHAPHTGRDQGRSRWRPCSRRFQSTRPIRGATLIADSLYVSYKYFNPRAPYGARPECIRLQSLYARISIHAPHTGRDFGLAYNEKVRKEISIHAPHTGRDRCWCGSCAQ